MQYIIQKLSENFEQACDEIPLAVLIDTAFAHKTEVIKPAEDELAALKQTQGMLETAVQRAMEKSGTEEEPLRMAGGLRASAILADVANPAVKDWDEFGAYVQEHDAMYLLQRRVSSTALLQELTTAVKIPGVEMETFKKLNIRKR